MTLECGKLCWTKVRQAACCCPWSQWCWWRCSQQTFSLEEWGAILSFQYIASGKVLVVWFSFVLNLGIKWEMWIFKFVFTPQHWRHTRDATTGTSLFKDHEIETILNAFAKQSWLSGKLALVCQQIRASAKCLKLCEKSIISNETEPGQQCAILLYSTEVILHFPSYHK